LQGAFAMHLGGKGFNQAVAARRLGADVAVIGRVGDDAFGAAFLDALDRECIDRTGVTVDPDVGTGIASIVVDPAGENAILQSPRATRATTAARVREAAASIAGASAALFQLEMDADGCREFAALARNANARVVFNAAPATGEGADLLALADLVVVNEIEAAALLGEAIPDPRAATKTLSAGARDAVLTLGARGAEACIDGELLHIDAFPVEVVDSVGAGDAFCAAFTVRLSEGASPVDVMRFASAAAALACTREGAEPSMPFRNEVEVLLAG
jgi:ribokinase